MKITGFLLFLLSLPYLGLSQNKSTSITQQEIIWLRYQNRLQLSERWQLNTDVDVRRFVFPGRAHQWVMPRINLGYKLNNGFELGAGAVYFLQALPQIDTQEINTIRMEIRPHQEVNYAHAVSKMKLSHRVRVEERFFLRTETQVSDFSFRYRYRFQVQLPIKAGRKEDILSFIFFDELMFNTDGNFGAFGFDQNRIYLGFQTKLTNNWTHEIGYMNWFQQRPAGDFLERHILRVSFTHALKIRKG